MPGSNRHTHGATSSLTPASILSAHPAPAGGAHRHAGCFLARPRWNAQVL